MGRLPPNLNLSTPTDLLPGTRQRYTTSQSMTDLERGMLHVMPYPRCPPPPPFGFWGRAGMETSPLHCRGWGLGWVGATRGNTRAQSPHCALGHAWFGGCVGGVCVCVHTLHGCVEWAVVPMDGCNCSGEPLPTVTKVVHLGLQSIFATQVCGVGGGHGNLCGGSTSCRTTGTWCVG